MASFLKSKFTLKKLILIILFVILFVFIGVAIYAGILLNKINSNPISDSDEALGIKPNNILTTEDKSIGKTIPSKDEISKIINIALFGLDRRNSDSNGRSDSIMIVTLDTNSKVIKITSIMRDTYVNIPGIGMDKINHAYAFGGPELAIKTINQNFQMNIRDYVMVDFIGVMDIIDSLGGVNINIKDYEASIVGVEGAGYHLLTGEQALTYSRIRYVGDGDYERTERQRTVLEEVINSILNAGITKYPKIVNQLIPYVETSLSNGKILSLGTTTFTSDIRNIKKFRVPVDGFSEGQYINGIYYLIPTDLDTNVNKLHDFIYRD